KQVQRACHDTLLWLISFSLDVVFFRSHCHSCGWSSACFRGIGRSHSSAFYAAQRKAVATRRGVRSSLHTLPYLELRSGVCRQTDIARGTLLRTSVIIYTGDEESCHGRTHRNAQRLTNRSNQPLAVVISCFDFMKQFSEFATLTATSGSSALSR